MFSMLLVRADLSGVNLADCDLNNANLGRADLHGANLHNANLTDANLRGATLIAANLREADLTRSSLIHADLINANLSRAKLHSTDLGRADLESADLSEAELIGASLSRTYLGSANLTKTNLTKAKLSDVVFANVNLSGAIGLETCEHFGPSVIDFATLRLSHPLPLAFLRGIGLPDSVIDYLPSLLSQPIQYYSCFISYSHKDEDFAQRLHADLQNKGVRCWFAPQDLPIGGKILDEIDAAIRLRDKVLLILSEQSINSDWVEDEVKTAFEEERKRRQAVLFPVRLDDAVLKAKEAWAAKLRADRHIGDFRQWRSHDQYQRTLERVLHDLKADQTGKNLA
jgi:hypothetical protein